jgi:DNA-binding NtrC family response regulator
LAKNQIIGTSAAIVQLMKDIEKVRRSNANVIIFAETGCGKELVARHIGAADNKPFVAVDSATITSAMAESILFGHKKGAFTGATGQSRGLFEEADGGTIYFDEIANMPIEIQAKLLRVIQEKEVMRLGSSRVLPLEFRVICATNKDLEKMSSEGKFKDDLYQRLNVIALRIPPLRERAHDLPQLAKHFFEKCRSETSPRKFSEDALQLLMKYRWPGNIRELENLIANLCAMVVDQEVVEIEDLPQRIREVEAAPIVATVSDSSSEKVIDPATDFYQYMHSLEGKVLRELHRMHQGNITQMSKSLKISRSQLYAKLNSHAIH